MIVAIHQPNFFPWLGYFYKIYASDVFIFHDNVEFTKRSFTKRTLIRKNINSQEKKYLIVPIKKDSDYTLIRDISIDTTQNWQLKSINQLKNVYHKAPFFRTNIEQIENILLETQSFQSLSKVNIFIIEKLSHLLGLKTHFEYSSRLPVIGKGTCYNVNLVKELKGSTYLSGIGGKKYQEEKDFINIKLKYHNLYQYLSQNPYPQQEGKFLNGLSVLDALFNLGADGILKIFNTYYIDANP